MHRSPPRRSHPLFSGFVFRQPLPSTTSHWVLFTTTVGIVHHQLFVVCIWHCSPPAPQYCSPPVVGTVHQYWKLVGRRLPPPETISHLWLIIVHFLKLHNYVNNTC